jgi:hypothetical protein
MLAAKIQNYGVGFRNPPSMNRWVLPRVTRYVSVEIISSIAGLFDLFAILLSCQRLIS